MPDATTELDRASADIALTRDAREILERAVKVASARGSLQVAPADVFNATLQLPGSLADTEIHALGFDPKSIPPLIESNGAATSPSLRHLLVNANREAQVLGHYQVDSIHLLLAMLYSDSPSTSVPLQKPVSRFTTCVATCRREARQPCATTAARRPTVRCAGVRGLRCAGWSASARSSSASSE